MIRPLRKAHRLTVTMLAVIVPAMLAVVLTHRHAISAMAGDSKPSPFAIRLASTTVDRRLLEIAAPIASMPEVLVYWSTRDATTLDAHAVLLGRLDGSTTRVGVSSNLHGGRILLYSPPLGKILAQQDLPDGSSP